MARLTQEQFDGYMNDIMQKYDNPEEAAPMLEALRGDFAESMAVSDNTSFVPRSDYDSLRDAYISRFFGGQAKIAGVKADQAEDVKQDLKLSLTFENLFDEAESYNGKDEN